jgi:uncharacterized Zn finger protein
MSKRRRYYETYEGYEGYGSYGFPRYQTVASKRARAARDLAKLRKRNPTLSPVVVIGRTIAETFWGEAWCDNLERYSDYANRLPRGRSYVCNGLVLDLQVGPGCVTALVSGTRVYEVRVAVDTLPRTRWRAVCRDVSGAIDSVIELLQGRLSDRVMARLCAEGTGLFPSPKEIRLSCTCPDWADMCKHVAAVLYGIGARLDREPALLFTLRKVDEEELVGGAGARAAAGLVSRRTKGAPARKVVDEVDLADVFGIDIAPTAPAAPPRRKPARRRAPSSRKTRTAAATPKKARQATADTKRTAPKAAKTTTTRKKASMKSGLSRDERRAIIEAVKRRWATYRREKRKAGSG